jgi:ribosome-associated toxin RatA of RatAB toxin-antitoxin module
MTDIRRSALVPSSAHEMFTLVADIAAYPQFLPWCGGARVLSANEDEVIAAIDIAYGGVHKTFTTRNLLQRDKMMELRLLEGPFSRLQGFWRFEALDEQACRISLDLEFEIANRLLGAVLGRVFGTVAGEMVEGFHRRAQQLYGKRP